MAIITEVGIRNFKCFRSKIEIPISQGTFLIGINNAGKSAVLEAIRCFFDDSAFLSSYINRTELTSKKEGYNRSEISIIFDINEVQGKTRKKRMLGLYGDYLEVKKSFSWREATNTVVVEYIVNGNGYVLEDIPKDVKELISAVSISYIHPQEGADLLAKAQDKFKQRLFHNWGRHASVAEQVRHVEDEWDRLKSTANTYLSSALSAKLREIWPNAEVKIELPDKIKDIVAVSDISFRSSPTLPQISLTSHGTGAQSAILYQTHYVLDTDRSLHQGQYYPVWLLEEPESFLHADVAFQISRLLGSDEWLHSIQMIVSTHSPIILAGSTRNPELTSWNILETGALSKSIGVSSVDIDDIDQIGKIMGDGNFGVYFQAAKADHRIFLEDSRPITATKLKEAGVPDPVSLNGVGDVDRHLRVLTPLGGAAGKCFFIVDADKGAKEIKYWIDNGHEIAVEDGWRKISCGGECYLILLPDNHAIEHLFVEWPAVLQKATEDLYDYSTQRLNQSCPMDLSRAAGVLRNRAPHSPEEGHLILASQQDVKDRFWNQPDINLDQKHARALLQLLEV